MNHPSTPIIGAVLIGTLALGACQRQRTEVGQTGADVTTFALNEVFRIGDESAGDTLLFGRVYGMAVDSRGQLFVTHDRLATIRRFSAQGSFLGSIGEEGAGPGEFAMMPDVYAGPDDTLYAWDGWNDRLTVFAPGPYEYVSSMMPASSSNGGWPDEFIGPTENGPLVLYYQASEPASSGRVAGQFRSRLLDWNGLVIRDSVAQLTVTDRLVSITENSIRFFGLPFGARAHFVLSPDNILYYGSGEVIDIKAIPLDSDRTQPFQFHISHSPVPVSTTERQETNAAYPGLETMIREQLPAFKPAFSTLLSDDHGRLWIQLNRHEADTTNTWVVVGPSGQVLGEMRLSTGIELHVVRDGRAFGTLTDQESQAPMVVAWEIIS